MVRVTRRRRQKPVESSLAHGDGNSTSGRRAPAGERRRPARHLSAGEIADVVGAMPADIRELFPLAAIAAWQEQMAPAIA